MARKSTFEHVSDWPAMAKNGNYESAKIAALCGVKLRSLEYFFKRKFRKPPIKMFNIWMAADVDKKVHEGMGGKQIIDEKDIDHIHYSHQSSLTRAMMNATGHGLRRDRRGPKG